MTYIDFVANGTIDERILFNLKTKQTIGKAVLGDQRAEWLDWFQPIGQPSNKKVLPMPSPSPKTTAQTTQVVDKAPAFMARRVRTR